jgi:hypothetical protein
VHIVFVGSRPAGPELAYTVQSATAETGTQSGGQSSGYIVAAAAVVAASTERSMSPSRLAGERAHGHWFGASVRMRERERESERGGVMCPSRLRGTFARAEGRRIIEV